jgi:hypothetical protein
MAISEESICPILPVEPTEPAPGLLHLRPRLEPFAEQHVVYGIVNRVFARVEITKPRLIAHRVMQ